MIVRGSGEIGDTHPIQDRATSSHGGSSPPSRIYGPYVQDASKGRPRRFVILHWPDGSKRSVSFARFMWEEHVGDVPEGHDVHHVNGDRLDDRIENLHVVESSAHRALHARGVEMVEIVCVRCGGSAVRKASDVRGNRKKGRGGPYCGRSCAGKASRESV